MSRKMLTQYALWEQDLSQGIDEAVETNSEIQETDQIFEEQIAFLRKELQKIGRKDLTLKGRRISSGAGRKNSKRQRRGVSSSWRSLWKLAVVRGQYVGLRRGELLRPPLAV